MRIPVTVQLSDEAGHRDLRVDRRVRRRRSPTTASRGRRGSSSSSARWRTSASRPRSGAHRAGRGHRWHSLHPRPPPPSLRPAPHAPRLELSVVVARRPEKPKAQRERRLAVRLHHPRGSGRAALPRPGAWVESRTRIPAPPATAGATSATGLLDALGHVPPNSSVWDSARRSTFWRGFADTVEQATDALRAPLHAPSGWSRTPTQLARPRCVPPAHLARTPRRRSTTPRSSWPEDGHRPADGRRCPARAPCSPSALRRLPRRGCDPARRSRWASTSRTTWWPGCGGSPRTTRSRCRRCRWTGSPTRSSGTSSPTWSGDPTTASSSASGTSAPRTEERLRATGPLATVGAPN